MKPNEYKISSEKFVFRKDNDNIHDTKIQTKPVSYLKDAFYRFRKNKASIVAGIIIVILLLFAIFGPLFTPYEVANEDNYYRFTLPKNELFAKLNINFWDGTKKSTSNSESFYKYYAMGVETGHNAVVDQKYTITESTSLSNKKTLQYNFRLDTYHSIGTVLMSVDYDTYASIQAYQDKTGIQVIYPITIPEMRPKTPQDEKDGNFWYKTYIENGKTFADFGGQDLNYTNIYREYTGTDNYTSSVRFEGDEKLYDYSISNQTGYEIRVNYYEYYIYHHTYVLKDGITKPSFLLGTTNNGKDLLACLASGARFSFILAIIVATVNLFIGAIYGAIEGYYGGKTDLIMERIADILSGIPFMIVISILKFSSQEKGVSHVLLLFIAFFITGWIGMASRTRMQFYRFKNQEYVLVARTLGASDFRIMFKHIFPNAIGTLITGSVLVIPSVIFSETTLSYLGIINLSTGNMTSIGTLLSIGQQYLFSYPHIILFPSIFISLLMLSFNLFGNGLRDAFNPSLRGSEE